MLSKLCSITISDILIPKSQIIQFDERQSDSIILAKMKEFNYDFIPLIKKSKLIGYYESIRNHKQIEGCTFIDNAKDIEMRYLDVNLSISDFVELVVDTNIKHYIVKSGNRIAGVVCIDDLKHKGSITMMFSMIMDIEIRLSKHYNSIYGEGNVDVIRRDVELLKCRYKYRDNPFKYYDRDMMKNCEIGIVNYLGLNILLNLFDCPGYTACLKNKGNYDHIFDALYAIDNPNREDIVSLRNMVSHPNKLVNQTDSFIHKLHSLILVHSNICI